MGSDFIRAFRLTFRQAICLLVLSLLFGASCTIGLRVVYPGSGLSLGVFLGFAVLMGLVYWLLVVVSNFVAVKTAGRSLRSVAPFKGGSVRGRVILFAICFTVVWVCWLFYYALYYPGCTSVDSNDILKMVLGYPFESDHFRYDQWNSHHPIVYTFLVALFVRVGNAFGGISFGVGLFSLFQMTLLAACSAYAAYWIGRRSGSRVACLLSLLFFALNPLIARYSVTLWKDVLFAGALLCFCLKSFDLVASKGRLLGNRAQVAFLVASAAGVFFLRSNGFLVVLMAFLVYFVVLKGKRRRFGAIAGISLVSFYLAQTVFLAAFSIVPAHFAEASAFHCSRSRRR